MGEEVRKIIALVLGIDAEEVELDTVVGDLPGWDSLRHLQIITELERQFKIKYSNEELAELEDVSDLVKLTEKEVGKA